MPSPSPSPPTAAPTPGLRSPCPGDIRLTAALLILYGFSFATSLSAYSIQITTMLGLGLGIDYALLIVTRFREVRAATPAKWDVRDCVRRTVAGAGRTVFFSGLTVAVSLAGLVVYQSSFLRSMGLAATAVVSVDMLAAVIRTPDLPCEALQEAR